MAKFDLFVPLLKEFEGGFVWDPDDPGGATNMGVTIGTFRTFFGRNKTVQDLKNMTESQWRTVMVKYWNNVKADQIAKQGVAEMLVDWYINAGMNAITAAQRALGTTADGIVGPKTIALLNRPDAFEKIQMARVRYYVALVEASSWKIKFLESWMRRTVKITNR